MTDVVVIGGVFRERFPHQNRTRPGGSGFVAALCARALGVDVALISHIGRDDSDPALRILRRAGVNTDSVHVLEGQSGIFSISDLADRRAPRPGYRPPDAPLTAVAADVPTAPVVLAFGFPGFDPLPLIKKALTPGGILLWDTQGWLSVPIDRLAVSELPGRRRINLANLEEMRAEANQTTYSAALAQQPPAGFTACVVKCGRWGAIVFDDEARSTNLIPAFITNIRSAIGSGDCFAGVIAASLSRGATLTAAATDAAAASSLFVERDTNIPVPGFADAIASVLTSRRRTAVSPTALERTTLYLAGPWFTAAEELLVSELEDSLEQLGLHVVSPRRDLGELRLGAGADEARELGKKDYRALEDAQLVCALLDHADEGTSMEIGYAIRAGKSVIALDSGPSPRPYPMREAGGVRVVATVGALLEAVTEWARTRYGVR